MTQQSGGITEGGGWLQELLQRPEYVVSAIDAPCPPIGSDAAVQSPAPADASAAAAGAPSISPAAIAAAVASALAKYEPLMDALWIANAPTKQRPARTVSCPVATQGNPATPLADHNALRRGCTITAVTGDILIGPVSTVGQQGAAETGTRIFAGGTATLAGGEWTEDIFCVGASATTTVNIREEIVIPAPWWPNARPGGL